MLYIFLDHVISYSGLTYHFFPDMPKWGSYVILGVCLLIGYLLGSINTAIIVSGRMYKDDIRKYGSGNAGFTNVMRTDGKKAAFITLAGDFLKTVVAVMIGWCGFGYLGGYLAGFACFIGHIFPVYYQFKGGKGVLCLTSLLFMLDWRIFLILFAIFLITVALTKYISLGAVVCAMIYPLLTNRLSQTDYMALFRGTIFLVALAIAVIIFIKHIGNLKRIQQGTESKFSFKKSKPSAAEDESHDGQ